MCPAGVGQVIDRRLARLSATCRRLVDTAAACPRRFEVEVVARAAGLDQAATGAALAEACDADLIRPAARAESATMYEFRHALVREALYAGLGPARRSAVHRAIAHALERTARPGERAAELAHHYHRSAALPGAARGVAPALAAADHAAATGAHDQALRFLDIALDLLPAADVQREHLLERRALVQATLRS